MNIKIKSLLSLGLCLICFSSCVDQYGNTSNASGGTVLGALGGAFVGSQMGGGTGGGAVIGALMGATVGGTLGNRVGSQLDNQSKRKIAETSYYVLDRGQIGRPYYWHSDNYRGYVKPTNEYSYRGMQCREYVQSVMIGGRPVEAYGEACRQPDGSWKIMK